MVRQVKIIVYTMDNNKGDLCFVCDAEVSDKGIYLSTEKTFFTKTDFPTKLSQMIGDQFMVVLTEEDRLCVRCTTLINKSDKLELDLHETNKIITEFLNIKYNLDAVEASINTAKDLNNSKEEAIIDQYYSSETLPLLQSSQEDEYQPAFSRKVEEFEKASVFISTTPPVSVNIKSEPNICKSDNCSNEISNEKQVKSLTTEDFSENKSAVDKKPHNLDGYSNIGAEELQTLHNTIFDEVKEERLTSDFNLNSTTAHKKPSRKGSVTSIIKTNIDNKTCIKSKEELKNEHVLDERSLNVLLSSNVKKETISIVAKNEKGTKVKSTICKHKTKPVKKMMKKRLKMPFVRKLRPILPKLPNSDILGPLYIIDTSAQSSFIEASTKESNNKNLCKTKETKSENLYENSSIKFNSKQNGGIATKKQKIIKKQEVIEKDLKLADSNINFNCSLCKKHYNDLQTLKDHEKEHLRKKKVHKCNFCHKVFKTNSGLQNHEAAHKGKFTFYCDICGNGFMYRTALEEHRGRHTKEERFVCEVCGKKFSFQSTYWIHRKWHDNPFPYKCNDCGRLFKHTSWLAVHRRKHTGERPYKCPYCSLTFTVTNTLKRHLILHTKEYPFSCDTCKQGFTTRFKYTEHLAKAHNIIVDKPSIEKKDYKMVIYDDFEHSKINEPEFVDTISLENSGYNVEDAQYSVQEMNDNIVEIVLEPSSVFPDHSLTLSDSWLT